MQNKANFRKSQMNVTNLLTVNYEKKTLGERRKNKANTKPIQSQTKPISEKPKTNVTYLLIKSYEQLTMNNELIKTNPNKPKTNPTCSELACPERSRRGRTCFRIKKILLSKFMLWDI